LSAPANTLPGNTLNVSELIDTRKLGGVQILTLILCALVTFIDGIDTQSIGIVARPLMEHLGVSMGWFPLVAADALVGAGVGALTFGQLGDRFGRKQTLVTATLLFGVFTIGTALATNFWALIAFRFVAGVGMGGAMPNVVSLNDEYAPRRIRALMVLLQWSSFPFGGTIGGLAARSLLQHFAWPSVFYFGGVVALIVALLLATLLPESLKYLIARKADPARISRIVNRVAPGAASPTTHFVLAEETVARANLWTLFSDGRTPVTLSIWVVFAIAFSVLLFTPLYSGPLLGGPNGYAPPDIGLIVAANNFGSMIGGVIAGLLMDRLSPYVVLTPAFVLGTVFTIMIGHGPAFSFFTFTAIVACSGFFMGVGGNGSVALAAMLYPTAMRATGMGWAVSLARFGQVTSSLLTGVMVAAMWSPTAIYNVTGGSALIAAAAVLVIWMKKPTRY
jgi:AAHS family 4-hydroxybenzoate transporter-like MFS transporter